MAALEDDGLSREGVDARRAASLGAPRSSVARRTVVSRSTRGRRPVPAAALFRGGEGGRSAGASQTQTRTGWLSTNKQAAEQQQQQQQQRGRGRRAQQQRQQQQQKNGGGDAAAGWLYRDAAAARAATNFAALTNTYTSISTPHAALQFVANNGGFITAATAAPIIAAAVMAARRRRSHRESTMLMATATATGEVAWTGLTPPPPPMDADDDVSVEDVVMDGAAVLRASAIADAVVAGPGEPTEMEVEFNAFEASLAGGGLELAGGWWDVDLDEAPYPSAPPPLAPADLVAANEQRRQARKKQRAQYFANNTSVRRGSPTVIKAMEEDLASRLAPGRPLSDRIFDSREIGAAQYGMALACLCREQRLEGGIKGEGTFSDVYAVDSSAKGSGLPDGGAAFFRAPDWCVSKDGIPAEDRSKCAAVLKCSVPFPGVIQGRPVGDGLGIGEVEATVLANIPRHPNVVRLLAAFLSEERNESYILLGDAGANLHAMRERGEVTPRGVRRHVRDALRALAHCHSHGVVHRDVKGGNILVNGDNGTGKGGAATLIDFGVARHESVIDAHPAARYGTPGYQAPELLMTDMAAAENDLELYQKVDMFALGCTMFFLCTGRELYGAGGEDGSDLGARTKTKERARAAQAAIDAAMEEGVWAMDSDGRDSASGLDTEEVAEDMVVKRMSTKAEDGGESSFQDVLSFGGKMNLNPLLARVLGQRAAEAEAEAERSEEEIDLLMLMSMADFPGYEPRTEAERAYVLEAYGGRGVPPAAPLGRETLPAFIHRKLTPRQPPGFASLVAACLARHPEDRPTAEEALNWPGAWVDGMDDA